MESPALPIHTIDSVPELNRCCESWGRQRCLALDTEFIRTNTFYPKPGLLQLADRDGLYLVDPLAVGDWSSFTDLLSRPELLWIMHSPSEDLVLLLSAFAAVPRQIFDTQTAAAYVGLGFSLSYQALVKQLLDRDLPKDETRSDWLRRPLSEAQLQYAAADVVCLLELHQVLAARLKSTGLADWLREDMAALLTTAREQEDPRGWQDAYAGVAGARRLSGHGLRLLQALCEWREQQARARNKPRHWIARDNELHLLAAQHSTGELDRRGRLLSHPDLSRQLKRRHGKTLWRLLENPPPAAPIDPALLSPPLRPRHREILQDWRRIALAKAEQLKIAPELLARKRWLQELLTGYGQTGQLQWKGPLGGWRQQQLQADFERSLGSAAAMEGNGKADFRREQ